MTARSGDTRLRPNPFSFLSDTMARFGLLVFAILGTTPILVTSLGEALLPGARATQQAMAACVAALPTPPPELLRGNDLATRFGIAASYEQRASTCFVDPSALLVPLSVGAIAVVAVAAFACYWCMPWWRIRRRGLVPLRSTVTPLLDELVAVSGAGPVEFLADLANPMASGLAFGRIGRRCVALGSGLLLGRDTDRLCTVVLHELAHVRNRDIDPTYLAIAVWRAFAVLVLLPCAVLTVVSGPATWLPLGGRLVVFAAVVLLIRNSVLRSRELYADARVAQWGRADSLLDVLGSAAPVGRVAALTGTHPDPTRRRAVVTDTALLARPGWWEGAALGVTTTFAYDTVHLIISWAAPTVSSDLSVPLVFGVFLLPAGFGLVLSACRGQLAELVTGQPVRTDLFALGLGVGFAASFALAPQTAFLAPDEPAPGWGHGLGVAGWPAWGAVVVVATWAYVRWVTAAVRLRMARVVTAESPRGSVVGYSVLAAAGFAVWLPYLLDLPSYTNITQHDVFPDYSAVAVLFSSIGIDLAYTVPTAALLVAVVAVWGVPLAPYLRRGARPPGAVRPWVTTTPPPDGWRAPRPDVRPDGAVRTGLLVAAIGVVVISALYVVAAVLRATAPGLLDPVATAIGLLPVELGILGSLVAAVVAAARAPAVPVLHGLLAACVPAVPIAMIGEVIESAALCAVNECGSPDFADGWTLLWLLWPRALLVALVLACAAAAVRLSAARIRYRRDRAGRA